MNEEFVWRNFPKEIMDLFGGKENMSTFPILEWDTEWNDLRDRKRFCPTEPRWISKDKITAPFMMGVAFDHNELARPFVLIRTTTGDQFFHDELQIFLLYRYGTLWYHSCWTSYRSLECENDSDYELESDEYFNDFDPRYDDATSIFEDRPLLLAKKNESMKGIKKIGNPEYEYNPRTCIPLPNDEYEMNDYSWNSDRNHCLLDEEDGQILDPQFADMIYNLSTKKCIKARHSEFFDDLVEYKVI